jgi:superfamily I DNA/RNA helicase/Txe/YoeB family toxin of Txe-Axe toxin-antitoxin module
MEYKQTITKEFWNDFSSLSSEITQRAKRAIDRMIQDPWAAELHPEKVKSAEPGIHSCRVDDKYRIIWKHIKPNNIVFLLIDNHDRAYERSARKSFKLDEDVIKVVDIMDVGAQSTIATGPLFQPISKKDSKYGTLFIGYTDKEILDWGVPTEELSRIRSLDNINQLEQVERLLPDSVFMKLAEIALGIIERPIVPDDKLDDSLNRNQGGEEIYKFLDTDEFKRMLDGSMEEWMLFLAPFQRSLTLRSYNGPVRLRGVAGSGKTVVAIHRARQLARQALESGKRTLFVTYGNRLPGVNSYLLNQLAGEDAPELEAIECRSIHQWCAQFLSERGINLHVINETQKNDLLFNAINLVRLKYPDLKFLSHSTNFFEDEIRYVLKGKAIQTLDDYLALDRSGRGTALQPSERQAMFEIFQFYQASLEAEGDCDWEDFILQSLEQLKYNEYISPYQSAIVDELQDLTESTLILIRWLVPPGPDDLFLVGDGLQRIYPGGLSLRKIGIDLTGRGVLLRKNYRNTQEILRAAHAVMENNHFDDLEDEPAEAEEPEYSLRRGELPFLRQFASPEQEIDWIETEIRRLQVKGGYQTDQMAIVYRWRRPYQDLITTKLQAFNPTELERDPLTYFGPGLKHTTFHSVKGLEFKVVFVVGVTDGTMVPRDDWSLEGDELEDYLAREQRLLYVAMTRARDLLYVTCARGMYSRFLSSIPPTYIRHNL